MKLESIRKKLEEKKQENEKKIELTDERTKMANANQFEKKTADILIMSLIYYALIFIPSLFFISSQGINTFTNIIPPLYYPAIVLGGSLGLGTLTKCVQNYQFHIKERIKKFSKAKTESQKIVEEVQYEIEKQKALINKVIINKALDKLNISENFSKTMTYKLLNDPNIDYSKEDFQENIKIIENLINERYENIDNLATKLVLYNRFRRTVSRLERISDLVSISFLGMFFTMFTVNIPFLIIRDLITYSSDLVSLGINMSGIIGYLGTGCYLLKRNHDHKLAFNQLNTQLGDKALPQINDKSYNKVYEKKDTIIELIVTQIEEISTAVVKIIEEQQKYEKSQSSKENGSKTLSKIKSHEDFNNENRLLQAENLHEKTNVLVRKLTP